jgi:hypothetical protein
VPLEEHDNSPAEAAERLWHDLGGWGAPDRCDPIATRGASIQCSGLKAAVTGAYCAAQQGTVPGCFLGRFLPELGGAASPASFSSWSDRIGSEAIHACFCCPVQFLQPQGNARSGCGASWSGGWKSGANKGKGRLEGRPQRKPMEDPRSTRRWFALITRSYRGIARQGKQNVGRGVILVRVSSLNGCPPPLVRSHLWFQIAWEGQGRR